MDLFHTLNQGFAVMVRITAKPGEEDALAEILRALTAPSNAEPGIKAFVPYRSPDNRAEFYVYELYDTAAGWDAHNHAPHFLAVVENLVEKAEFRERLPFIPL